MVKIPLRIPRSETPRHVLNRRAGENSAMPTAVGLTEVAWPTHVETDLLTLPLAEAGRHDDILRAEGDLLHELREVLRKVWMDAVIITEVEQPITRSRDSTYVSLEQRINRVTCERTEGQMSPAFPRVEISDYYDFIKPLCHYGGHDEFI